MKIRYLIVLYNKDTSESITIKTLRKNNPIVWNNGPYEVYDKTLEVINNCKNENLGFIYNKFLEGCDYLCILDDDTELPENFNEIIISEITNYPNIDIFIPKLLTNKNKTISPTYDKYGISNAAMSGLVVRSQGCIKFNEDLSFYGVDTDFIYRAKQCKKIKIMDLKLIHDISFNREMSCTEKIWRREKLLESQLNMLKIGMLKDKFKYLFNTIKNICSIMLLRLFKM